MIDIEASHLEKVLQILEKHLPAFPVWAYGSRVKGNARPYSDLDLAVISTEDLSLKLMADLKNDFAESDLPFRVEICDWMAISEDFRNIIKENYFILKR